MAEGTTCAYCLVILSKFDFMLLYVQDFSAFFMPPAALANVVLLCVAVPYTFDDDKVYRLIQTAFGQIELLTSAMAKPLEHKERRLRSVFDSQCAVQALLLSRSIPQRPSHGNCHRLYDLIIYINSTISYEQCSSVLLQRMSSSFTHRS